MPQNKRGEIALTYIYGIGRSSSAKILDKAGVSRDLKVSDWSDDQAAKIREIIGAEFKVEGDLRSEIQMNIKRLMDIGCYRGVRHRNGLPVRGQSTKNNARTRKGKKKTVANKKKEFFKFFNVDDLDNMVSVSVNKDTLDVTVTIEIPLEGDKKITFSKCYHDGDKDDKGCDKVRCFDEKMFDLAIFPSYRLPQNNAYNIMLGTTKLDDLKLKFYRQADLVTNQYIVDDDRVAKLPEGMSLDYGAMIEPSAVGAHASNGEMAKAAAKQAIRQSLENESSELHKKLDNVLGTK